MLKYDYKPLPIDPRIDTRVASSMKKFFLDAAGSIPVSEWEPVFNNVKARSASGLSHSRDKGDHLRNHGRSIVQFWDVAHTKCVRCLWKCVPKEEILPDAKLDENDLRVFLIGPADQYFSHARVAHNFDEYILEKFHTGRRPFGYGVSIHTLRSHLRPLLGFPIVGYSDAKRYDATVGHTEFIRDVVDIRRFCHDEKSMPVEEFTSRLTYYLDDCSVTYVLTPSGHMYEKVGGAPSGKKSTTMDNTIVHLKRWVQVFWNRLGLCLHSLIQQGRIWLSLFGDDVVFGMDKDLYDALGWSDYSVYQADFLRVGQIVKPEMYIGPDISKLSYLGMRLGTDENGLTLTFPPEKLLAALFRPKRKFTTDENVMLLNSLSLLCPFDRGMYDLVTGYIRDLGGEPQFTFDGVRYMWTGFEGGMDLKSLSTDPHVSVDLTDPVLFDEFLQENVPRCA